MSFDNWKELKLKDAPIEIIDGDRGKNYPNGSDFLNESFCLFLNAKNVTSSGFKFDERMFIGKEKDQSLRKGKLIRNDIVLTTRGTIGNIAYYNNLIKYENIRINSGMVILRCDNSKILSQFCYWLFRSPVIQNRISSFKTGSAQPQLPISVMKELSFKLPSINEQSLIADTLSCLDDKIELNNRINKNLEEMAQAVFKSWFVDFEPFQDGEFKSTELGRIPKGWKVGVMSDLGDIIGGSTPSKTHPEYFTDNGIAWITPKDLSNTRNKFISKGEIDITELGLKNCSARIMPEGTVLYSSRAPIGYIAIAQNKVTTNQGFKSIVPNIDIGNSYIYYYLKNNLETILNRASGSTFMEISGSAMKKIPVIIPDRSTLTSFQEISAEYFEKQLLLENQNKVLGDIRDSLLPKLMSGDLRIPIQGE